jgi:hypothetical protein
MTRRALVVALVAVGVSLVIPGVARGRGEVMRAGRWVMGLALVVVAAWSGGPASAASVGGSAAAAKPPPVDEKTPILEPDGPLRGAMMTGALPTDGPITEWRVGFTTADREAVAVVGLGDDAPKGAKVVVAWYVLEGPGKRTHLFSHKVKARADGGLVFSRGVAEKGLAPGNYEVVATLGKRQVRAPWVVRIADEPASGVVGRGDFSAPGGEESTLADWERPSRSEQGYHDDEPAPPAEPSGPGPCTLDSIDAGMTPMTDVSVSAWYLGSCSARTLTAAVTGPPVTVASSAETEGPVSSLNGAADVCTDLAGGSDLPGTVVHLAATGSDGATATSDYTLPDLGEIGPVVGIETQPPAGTRVEAGDTITVTALAMLIPPALGVKVLYLSAGDELLESVPNLSGSSEPVPCDLRRNYAVIQRYRYEVPDDPPPVVTLQADAADFQDRQGEHSTATATFPTIKGEVWEGTVTSSNSAGAGSCNDTTTSPVQFVVEEGSGDFEVTTDWGPTVSDCPGVGGTTYGPVHVTGRVTRNRMTITGPGGLVPPGSVARSGDRIDGSYTNAFRDMTWELQCVSCDAEAGG